jgi:opacity protein-like surface antigen
VSEITVSLVVLTAARGHEACNIHLSLAGESMARFQGLLTSIVLVLSCFAAAQDHFAPDHSKVDIFGGYQFTHVALGHDSDGFNLNGWNASVSGYFNKYLGISADFSGGRYDSPFGINSKVYPYLVGPTARFPKHTKMTPFAHVLFGGAHLNASSLGLSGSDNSFAWAMGGGVDVYVSSRFSVRLAEADWLRTQFADSTQSNFRCSGGVVIKF